MRSKLSGYSAALAVFALTASFRLAPQDTQNHNKHHHYRFIDLGTGERTQAAG
jgi:hypothetical protein